MADLTPEQKQYAAIELLYSERKWNDVLQSSETMLAALPPVQGHPLRPRLELVIGHTLLYGLADFNGAEQWYRTVLLDTEEPVLREIAEHGLVRCNEQRASAEAASGIDSPQEVEVMEAAVAAEVPAAEAVPESTAPFADAVGSFFTDVTAGQATTPAMPWETGVGPGVAGAHEGSATGSSPAMPWLAELGSESEPPAQAEAVPAESFAAEPVVNPMLSDSVRTARNSETTNVQEPPLQTPLAETPEATPADGHGTTTTEETLALLREPDELIPVTVQVLEEPPLSADEMTALARGLLEVVLR